MDRRVASSGTPLTARAASAANALSGQPESGGSLKIPSKQEELEQLSILIDQELLQDFFRSAGLSARVVLSRAVLPRQGPGGRPCSNNRVMPPGRAARQKKRRIAGAGPANKRFRMKTAFAMLSGARVAGLAAIAGAMLAASGAMAAPAGAGAGSLSGSLVGASAAAPMVSTVAGGCGPGMYRGAGGRCYRVAGPHAHHPHARRPHAHRPHAHRPPPPPRHYHAPHRAPHCVVQHTPHGPRRVCR